MSLPVITDSLNNYLIEINRYPVLTKAEELVVAERYYKTRSIEDAHTLVISNLRYVVKIALEYRSYGCRLADLIQEGNIGLMMAVKKFNPFKGFRLITYATWWIKSVMQEFILKTRGIVKREAKSMKKRLFYRNGAEAGVSNDPANAGVDLIDASNDLSLDVSIAQQAGNSVTHLDLLKDDRQAIEDAAADRQSRSIITKEVSGALGLLSEKERYVIQNRVMAEEPSSLQEIGVSLGLTRERIRQIETSALKKLQRALTGRIEPCIDAVPA